MSTYASRSNRYAGERFLITAQYEDDREKDQNQALVTSESRTTSDTELKRPKVAEVWKFP